MFDRVIWELSVMIRSAEFAFFSGYELVAGLSVYPDVLPGQWEPDDWQNRFAPIQVADRHQHEITPGQLRAVLPPVSSITWGQLAVLDLFRSRIWLHGRGEGVVLSFSKANPSAPSPPDQGMLTRIERELFELPHAVLSDG